MHSLSRAEVFGEEIGRILLTQDLAEVYAPAAHCLLDPEQVGVDVAHLTQTLSSTDPDRGGRVCPDSQWEDVAQICHQALESEAHAGTSNHSAEFRLATAQRDPRLRTAP